MVFSKITEGRASLYVHHDSIPSRRLPVFYNSRMKPNRDLMLWVLANFKLRDFCVPFAGSGVRGIRALLELPVPPERVFLNDLSVKALDLCKKNVKLNKLSNVSFSQEEASKFLAGSKGFDYIDVDPYGTPVHCLKAAAQAIKPNGILGVSALDTAALCGIYPKTCKRRYWATPLHGMLMKEVGLRIFIRRVQLEAAVFDKALIPVFSIAKDHYFRVFFQAKRGISAADGMLEDHGFLFFNPETLEFSLKQKRGMVAAGPMFLGELWDSSLVKKMRSLVSKDCSFTPTPRSALKLCDSILSDLEVSAVGSYDLHYLADRKFIDLLSTKEVLSRIKGAKSALNPMAVKTGVSYSSFIGALRRKI